MIDDALIRARALRPYYSAGLAALRPVTAPGLGTIGVSESWQLIYDPDFLERIGLASAARIIADHELQHLLRRHAARRKTNGADPRAWNVAADAEINDDDSALADLVRSNGGVLPESLGMEDGLLAEEYLRAVSDQTDPRCGSGAGGEALPGEDAAGPNEIEAEAIRQHVVSDIRAAVSSGRGDIPVGTRVWADLEAAKIQRRDWRRDLVAAVSSAHREIQRGHDDYSWGRLHRRVMPMQPLRPGRISYAPSIHVVVDTSGSVNGKLASLAVAAADQIRRAAPSATWWACDAAAKKIRYGQWLGGGGTDMRIGYEAAVASGADLVVILTDGDTPWPAPSKKIVAVLIGSGKTPDGIKTVHIQE